MERRWLRAMVRASLPATPALDAGEDDTATLEHGLDQLRSAMPWIQGVALRFAVWLVCLLGPLGLRKLPPFTRLSAHDRDRALARLGASDLFVVREMVVLIKLVAALVRELSPSFRLALGWGGGRPVRIPGAES
ncbi:MAG: hypothetical protein QGH45_17625 [Myxococcota bacterium]|jgi:hypothetical protein|nr:hypothetical protein [Myxococcota bacterium]